MIVADKNSLDIAAFGNSVELAGIGIRNRWGFKQNIVFAAGVADLVIFVFMCSECADCAFFML